MSKFEDPQCHVQRHVELHRALDELVAGELVLAALWWEAADETELCYELVIEVNDDYTDAYEAELAREATA